MTRTVRRIIQAAIVLAVMVGLPGCWDMTAREALYVPVMMAIDWHAPDYEVTLATDSPQLMSTAGGSQSQGSSPTWIIRGRGHSLTTVLQRLGINYPNANPLPLAHLRIVVVGHGALTPTTLNTIWDRFNRARYLHRTFWVFGTSGSAAIIAQAINPTGPDPTHALVEALDSARASGWVKPLRFYHIAETLYNTSDSGIVLPMVSVESEQGPNPGVLFRFPGAWVLTHQGSVAGQWSRSQVEIWMLLRNDRPHLLLTVPAGHYQSVAVDATKERTHLSWRRGTIHVRTSISASLLGIDGAPPTHAAVDTKAIQQALAVQLVGRIARLVQWTQQHKVDVLGIDTGIEARHPVWFTDHASQWPTIYARAPVVVQVHVILRDTENLRGQ